jgi:hypothetical protein
MHLNDLISLHKHAFKEKVVQAFAEKYSTTREFVLKEQGEVIDRYVHEKYKAVERAASKIMEFKRPVVLSIRRDPCSDDVCMICERDKPEIEALRQLYGNRIIFFEIYDSSAEAALYHIIYQGEGEKLLPMTVVIHRGEVKKYWTGRPVKVEESRVYLDPLV